ncbi:hypothetical protein C8Q76DRAFT_792931 [Earliella scabrosa]|nr:hypothetical protein C8Q76DRAFT_792931 [Earliella scabrosa]
MQTFDPTIRRPFDPTIRRPFNPTIRRPSRSPRVETAIDTTNRWFLDNWNDEPLPRVVCSGTPVQNDILPLTMSTDSDVTPHARSLLNILNGPRTSAVTSIKPTSKSTTTLEVPVIRGTAAELLDRILRNEIHFGRVAPVPGGSGTLMIENASGDSENGCDPGCELL